MAPSRQERDDGRQAGAGHDRIRRLDRQLAGWERRYARFVATEGASEPVADPADPLQAADFLLTITALAARRGALAGPHHPKGTTIMAHAIRPSPVREPAADKPLGSAILSLLVAADQRCPAIIGQAHLLYHARFSAAPEHAASTFTQLKREADDLFKAIADVEAAMTEAGRC